jgi:hypothetical protein
MRGFTTKTPERLAEAVRLREMGLRYEEIAERLGISRATAYAWIYDPDGAQLKARKDGYRKPCTECGTLTDGSVGPRREGERVICHTCAPRIDSVWTDDAILLAIEEWVDEHGGIPPASSDFQRAKRTGACVPSVNQVRLRFGRWANAIRAAGYEPHRCGPVGGFRLLTPAQRRQCADRYAAGETSVDIAAVVGCSPTTVLRCVRAAGVAIRPSCIGEGRAA